MSDVTGRCLCGFVAWRYDGEVGPATYCHCADCRRCTGSAFNVGVRLRRANLHLTAGEPKGFTKRGDSGRELTRHFCPECGSPIFTSAPKHPDHVYVKAGTFDDPGLVRPERQNWVASAVSWHRIPADLPASPKSPDA
jgi:hypothetical protein